MKILILVAIVTLSSIPNESSASPLAGSDGGDKQLGETCKACFSINIPEGCGICVEGLDCMPPKDDFGLVIPGAPFICVDLEADKKKWQAPTLPPLNPPKKIEDVLPKKEEKGKPCNVKNGKCLPKCSDLSDEDINRGVQCELDVVPEPEAEAELNKASANFQNMHLVCIASVIYLMKLIF